jgi:hypothetical protein
MQSAGADGPVLVMTFRESEEERRGPVISVCG